MIREKVPDNWKTYLDRLQQSYANWTLLGQQREGDGLSDATEMMQNRYPGNYKVEERYEPSRGMFRLYLKFNEPKDETFFLLKYS